MKTERKVKLINDKSEVVKTMTLEEFQEEFNSIEGIDRDLFIQFYNEPVAPTGNDLMEEVQRYIKNNFNNIQIDLLKNINPEEPLDIRYPEEKWVKENYIYNISDLDRQEVLEEYFDSQCVDEDDRNIFLNLSTKEQINDEEFFLWLFDSYKFESYLNDRRNDHYPMWNTIFEFINEPSEGVIEVFENQGLVIIEPTDYTNTCIGMSSAGHSFYSSYWIPVWLNLPWNKDKKEFYKDINYNHL